MAIQNQKFIKPKLRDRPSRHQRSLRNPGQAAKPRTMARDKVNMMECQELELRAPIPSCHPPKPPAAALENRGLKVRSGQGKDFAFLGSSYLLLPRHPNLNLNPKSNHQPHGAVYVLPHLLPESFLVAIPDSHMSSLLWQVSFGRGGAGNAFRTSPNISPTTPTTVKCHKTSST